MGGTQSGVFLAVFLAVLLAAPTAAFRPFAHLNGTTTSVVATTSIDVSLAASLLQAYDPRMQLDTASAEAWGFPSGQYPVMWMLNNMTNLYTTPVNIIPGLISQYWEFIVMLPFVAVSNGSETVRGGTTVQLWLNDFAAVTGGRLYYGMPKTLAHVQWAADGTFNASSEVESAPLMTAQLSIDDSAGLLPFGAFSAAMPLWIHFMERPIMQPSPDPLSGSHLCFEMPMDWAQTGFSKANLTLAVEPHALAGMPDGASFSIPSVTNPSLPTDDGAFYLHDAHWSLSAPWTSCFPGTA